MRRSILSAVVPAQAGTHTPTPIEGTRRMGPRLRGDDTERRRRSDNLSDVSVERTRAGIQGLKVAALPAWPLGRGFRRDTRRDRGISPKNRRHSSEFSEDFPPICLSLANTASTLSSSLGFFSSGSGSRGLIVVSE